MSWFELVALFSLSERKKYETGKTYGVDFATAFIAVVVGLAVIRAIL